MSRRGRSGGRADTDATPPAAPPASAAPPAQGRLLGVDWGEKRIGLAISDPSQTVATPLGTLTRRAGRRFPMSQLRPYLETHQPIGVVMGLPLDASGAEGPAAQAVRHTGQLIAARAGLAVAYWDERMTTARVLGSWRDVEGERRRGRRGRSGRSGKGAPRSTTSSAATSAPAADALAATVLLQAYLDRRRA